MFILRHARVVGRTEDSSGLSLRFKYLGHQRREPGVIYVVQPGVADLALGLEDSAMVVRTM